jgi:hypothetical protein
MLGDCVPRVCLSLPARLTPCSLPTLSPPPGAALLGSIKILQMDKVGLEERVFRLHYNESQKRNDTFAVVGG